MTEDEIDAGAMRQDYELALYSEMFTGRRGRLRAYIFELGTALVWVISGLAFLIAPAATALHSPVGRDVGGYIIAWSMAEVIGGIGVLAGVMLPSLQLRAAGLVLLGSALLMQFIAAVTFQFDLRVFNYVIFALACFLRVAFIVHTRERMVQWVKTNQK